jgi:predicted DNA-binding protein (UPF0251 family)
MPKLKPEIWSKNGKKKFVVLSYEEFESIRQQLEDAEDLKLLHQSKKRQAGAKTISLVEMKRRLGINGKTAGNAR